MGKMIRPRVKRFGKHRGKKYFPLGRSRVGTVVKVLVLGGLGFGAVWLLKRQTAFAEGPSGGSQDAPGGLVDFTDSGGLVFGPGGSGASTGSGSGSQPTAVGRAVQEKLNGLTSDLLPVAGGYAARQAAGVSYAQIGDTDPLIVNNARLSPLRVDGVVGPLTRERFRVVKEVFVAGGYNSLGGGRTWDVVSTEAESELNDMLDEVITWMERFERIVQQGQVVTGYSTYLRIGNKWRLRAGASTPALLV